ncbi:hypothetical protein E4U55_007080 [Claviceps digitariae]|nr:hypothetical protein E4U55_007080 [Claviceps digitariae]
MSAPTRIVTSRLRLVPPRLAASTRFFTASCSSFQELQWPQRMPLGDYYTSILRDPVLLNGPHVEKSEEPPRTADPSAQPSVATTAHTRSEADDTKSSSSDKNKKPASARTSTPATTNSSSPPASREPTPQEKARIIFGSRLLGPADEADKLAVKQARSTYVAGVLVPPQPEEPDNCCMSGCVNCVWDRFREDMEEWTAKKHEAHARASSTAGTVEAMNGDGHGRSSETSRAVSGEKDKTAEDTWDEEVYRNVPVGFREFMKQEKRLKEKHAREGTIGG